MPLGGADGWGEWMTSQVGNEGSAPGWEAIDRALARLYGDEKPLHWAPPLHYAIGGSDPLDGISAYRRTEPVPHWHFVTFGLSELYSKDSSDPNISGLGIELTFRVRIHDSDEPPPTWVFSFLQNLARYVFSSGNVFEVGHHMHLNGPIALGTGTSLWAIAFARDPELLSIDTPHGRLTFLQVIGITQDELAAIEAWNTASFLDLIQPHLPLLITDLTRPSLTDSADVAEPARAGARRDGSSTASLFVGSLSWRVRTGLFRRRRLVLTLGANGVRYFNVVLPARLLYGLELVVAANDRGATFVISDRCSWTQEGHSLLEVRLTRAAVEEIAQRISPTRGTYELRTFPLLSFEVVPSEITGADGRVVDVVG